MKSCRTSSRNDILRMNHFVASSLTKGSNELTYCVAWSGSMVIITITNNEENHLSTRLTMINHRQPASWSSLSTILFIISIQPEVFPVVNQLMNHEHSRSSHDIQLLIYRAQAPPSSLAISQPRWRFLSMKPSVFIVLNHYRTKLWAMKQHQLITIEVQSFTRTQPVLTTTNHD